MQVSITNNVKIYNLSAGKSLPEWLTERQRRKLVKNDIEVRQRIELIEVIHSNFYTLYKKIKNVLYSNINYCSILRCRPSVTELKPLGMASMSWLQEFINHASGVTTSTTFHSSSRGAWTVRWSTSRS